MLWHIRTYVHIVTTTMQILFLTDDVKIHFEYSTSRRWVRHEPDGDGLCFNCQRLECRSVLSTEPVHQRVWDYPMRFISMTNDQNKSDFIPWRIELLTNLLYNSVFPSFYTVNPFSVRKHRTSMILPSTSFSKKKVLQYRKREIVFFIYCLEIVDLPSLKWLEHRGWITIKLVFSKLFVVNISICAECSLYKMLPAA